MSSRPLYRSLLLAGSLLCTTVSSTLLLPGCGGGSDSSLSPRRFESSFTIAPAQVGRLTLRIEGRRASGALQVSDPVGSARQTQALSFAIEPGLYPISGSFSSPNDFTVSGTFPSPVGRFTISGETPDEDGSGNYTLTANSETVTGNFSNE